MMAITNVEQANADADVVPNHPLDPDPQVIAPASSTVRLYRVMCFHDGLWDNASLRWWRHITPAALPKRFAAGHSHKGLPVTPSVTSKRDVR